jgi:hypothetical protein
MSSNSWPRASAVLLSLFTAASCGDGPADPATVVKTIEISPTSARLYAVGQQVVFETLLTTEADTDGEGIPVAYVSRNPALVEVNAAGVATAKTKGGSTYVVTTAGGRSDSALVEVPATPCGSIAPTTMAVAQIATDIGAAGFCAAASSAETEYTVIVHNNSTLSSGSSAVEVTAVAVDDPPTAANFSKATANAAVTQGISTWRRDVAAEIRHRRAEQAQVAPLLSAARSWYLNRSRRASFATAVPAVGDIIPNVNVHLGNSCSDITYIDARVAAVSNSAIILHDPRNPVGFTDTEYAKFAQAFDADINPLNRANFGAPTDLDNNGRVLLMFTRSVNALIPTNVNFYVGGVTHMRDLMPKASCQASNQAEMFYLLAPDPSGTINQNEFSTDFVNDITPATVAHEFQHLINFGRRKYLNAATEQPFEQLWLNEGLSHIAEELLYYHRTGRTPRSNLGGNETIPGDAFFPFYDFMSGNFLNYDEYVLKSAETSPFAGNDELATRGASWALLRYLADHDVGSDTTFWYNLVNSGETGTTNVRNRLGITTEAAFVAAVRDFVISVYTDDYIPGVPAKYTQPSWNMRSIYPLLDQTPPFLFPLPFTPLPDAESRTAPVRAGGFKVYRFSGVPGADSFLRVRGAIGGPLPPDITITVIRTK